MIFLIWTLNQYLFLPNINVFFKLPIGVIFIHTYYINFYVFKIFSQKLAIILLNKLLNFVLYVLTFFLIFTTFRSTIPRFRLDLLLDFFWKYVLVYGFILLLVFYMYVV